MKYKGMLKVYKTLAAKFLEDHDNVLANRSCNDWDWPADWTDGEKREFARAMIVYNERRANPSMADVEKVVEDGLPDFAVCGLLAHLLKQDCGDI